MKYDTTNKFGKWKITSERSERDVKNRFAWSKIEGFIENIPAVTDKSPVVVGKSPAIIYNSPAVTGKRPAVAGKFSAVIGKLPVAGKQSSSIQ